MSTEWSHEDDALLVEMYSSTKPMKHQMHRLPGRTYPAAKARARRLGLEFKQKASDGSLSLIKAMLLKELERGIPMSDATLCTRIGASRAGMKPIIRRAHGVEIRIAGWERAGIHGWRPMWLIGNEPDEPKPARKSGKQACAELRERQRRAEGRFNPFSVAVGAVQPVKTARGRIYKHLVDDDREAA